MTGVCRTYFSNRAESQFQISIFFYRTQKHTSDRFCCIYPLKLSNQLISLFYFLFIIILKGLEIKWFVVLPSATAYARPQSYDIPSYFCFFQYNC